MNDFEYDVMQKKRIARGTYSKKRGSKSKRCRLPSDHMTQKQWKEKNGKVMVYEMNKPLSWKEFNTYPAEHQCTYISTLKSKYNIKMKDIAEMFGCSPHTLSKRLRTLGISNLFPAGGDMKAGEAEIVRRNWDNFICGEEPRTAEAAIILPQCASEEASGRTDIEEASVESLSALPACGSDVVNDKQIDEAPVETVCRQSGMNMKEFSLRFSGNINIDSIANTLRVMIDSGDNWSLEIKGIIG